MQPAMWFENFSKALAEVSCRSGITSLTFDEGIAEFQKILLSAQNEKRCIYWVGNGGSNAICTHLSQDIINKLGIRSFAINDPALITCMSNDFGYENVFSRPIATLAQKNDVLIAISSSGNSANILNAAMQAQRLGCTVITLSSFDKKNALFDHTCDLAFHLPAKIYGHAELGHAAIIHAAIECMIID